MKKLFFISMLLLSFILSGISAEKSALKLPSFFSDRMVLQQNFTAPIWGKAKPGSAVTIHASWLSEAIVTTADAAGDWKAHLKTGAAGGPFTISVTGDTTITIQHALFGEVWLCSGQSNMEMPVDSVTSYFAGAQNFRFEIATANYPSIRLFQTERGASTSPLTDVTGVWRECSPHSVANFSAVAYFFGKELHERLRVPIGLIQTCWGGSAAEAWTSKSALLEFVEFKDRVLQLDSLQSILAKKQETYLKEKAAWDKLVRAHTAKALKQVNRWAAPHLSDTSWRSISVPGGWTRTELDGFIGAVWHRKVIHIPPSAAKMEYVLELGPIDEMDVTWFNGKKIGEHSRVDDWTTPRIYTIPANLIKPDANTLLLLISNEYLEGGIYGHPHQVKMTPRDTSRSQQISLSGDWQYKICTDYKTLPERPTSLSEDRHRTPTMLYNAMIAPFIPFSFRGVIWYQGESNVSNAELYSRLFPAMIKNWREQWRQGDFPFYFVQIAPYAYRVEPQAAELREAQFTTLSLPNTGMVVTSDLGNKTDIHPRRKVEVGNRLALWALARTYGMDGIEYSGPLYSSHTIEQNRIRIHFDHATSGLYCVGDELTHFTIAGRDSVFVPAQAKIESNSVVVFSEQVPEPIAVRFGWSNTAEPNLYNIEGLPASSFRTDVWPTTVTTKDRR